MKPGVTAQPDGVELALAVEVRADLDDDAVGDRDVGDAPGRAAAVEDGSPPDDDVSRHLQSLSRIDHELEEVPVGIAHVHTRRVRVPPALAGQPGLRSIAAPASASSACSASGVPSHTKQRSPHGGRALGARSVKLSRVHTRAGES